MKRRRRRILTAVVAVALIGGAIAVALVLTRGGASDAERAAVKSYADAVKDLSFEGGRILQQDVKPRITELRDGGVTVEQFQREAANWIRLYENLRTSFAETAHPARLDEAARLYDEALSTYIEAFEAFLEASKLPTQDARNEAITEAVPIAERADQAFDRARDELAKQMRRVGLQPPSSL